MTMMAREHRLAGKIAVIIGASSGFGAATAELFAAHGAAVILAGRRVEMLDSVAERIRAEKREAFWVQADVRLEPDVQRVVDVAIARFGRVDVLVNNAGTQLFMTADATSMDEWNRVLETNLRGVWLGCKHVIPFMRAQSNGSIINTSSIYASAGVAGQAAYAASKGGVLSLTRQLAIELAPHNIRVNCLCPGWIDTEYARDWFSGQADPSAAWQATLAAYPLRRPGQPGEAANALLFLASDESSFITGQALYVDGGYSAQ